MLPHSPRCVAYNPGRDSPGSACTVNHLFHISAHSGVSLQQQLRQQMAAAILDGRIEAQRALPSTRALARSLGIGRNTVMLAYEQLIEDGFLIARSRSGYFVSSELLAAGAPCAAPAQDPTPSSHPDWQRWLLDQPSRLAQVSKPLDWQKFPYCFIYGQIDQQLFPLRKWRECWRDAVNLQAISEWSVDRFDRDDPLLLEQIRTRLLPRRGVRAGADEILVTLGAQQALYLAMRLLLGPGRSVGLENPGYVDARNIALMSGARIQPLCIDGHGLVVDQGLDDCDCLYVTPSHQSPSTVTLPLARRQALLERAASADFLIFEDDYEAELSFSDKPLPSLKSLDRNQRVLYLGSLSKTLAPGLRMGYLVAPPALISEARALRRLMIRHPAANNQRAVALFLARGYHDAMVRRLVRVYRERWEVLQAAMRRHLPQCSFVAPSGGSACWVQGPAGLDAAQLARDAAVRGVLIEPGQVHFLGADAPLNHFRLGYSSIATEAIEPGIRELARLL